MKISSFYLYPPHYKNEYECTGRIEKWRLGVVWSVKGHWLVMGWPFLTAVLLIMIEVPGLGEEGAQHERKIADQIHKTAAATTAAATANLYYCQSIKNMKLFYQQGEWFSSSLNSLAKKRREWRLGAAVRNLQFSMFSEGYCSANNIAEDSFLDRQGWIRAQRSTRESLTATENKSTAKRRRDTHSTVSIIRLGARGNQTPLFTSKHRFIWLYQNTITTIVSSDGLRAPSVNTLWPPSGSSIKNWEANLLTIRVRNMSRGPQGLNKFCLII